jgi:diguanylate cyclase (GGDEF)-like protein
MESRGQRTVVAVNSGFDIYQIPVINGARAVLAEHGISLIAHTDLESPVMPNTLACLMRMPRICGLILLCPRGQEHDRMINEPLSALGLPIVHIGQDLPGQACIRADNAQGMSELMSLLLDQCGVRHPMLLRYPGQQPDHVQREEIFRAEIARRGIPLDERRFTQEVGVDAVREETRRLMECLPDTDAVVTMHDWCALAAMEGCRDAGKRVPEDVVVTGFDNYPLPSIAWPGLTTVDQNLEEQGATAARIILAELAGVRVRHRAPTRHQVLTRCRVLPRGSTAVGAAQHTGVAPGVEYVAQLASTHLKIQDELDQLDQTLMRCRSLDQVCAALPASLPALGATRAYLVRYEGATDPPVSHGVEHHVSRLVLHFQDGQLQPLPEQTFSSCDLLPEYLREALHHGFLALQPLEGAEGPLGHLLLDANFGPVPIMRSLEGILNRTLDMISRIQALSKHSATLEHLVAERSRELRKEISVRQSAEQELRRTNAVLRRMETTDGLTRVANRRALERHLLEHWPRHIAEHKELTVLLVDVDHFKAYNDQYGHLQGDEALRSVATCLKRAARYPDDLVSRYGGEEFAVVLPASGTDSGLTVARRSLRFLTEAAIPHESSPTAATVTASIGIGTLAPTRCDAPERIIALADAALYRAKREGRNRIVVSD